MSQMLALPALNKSFTILFEVAEAYFLKDGKATSQTLYQGTSTINGASRCSVRSLRASP